MGAPEYCVSPLAQALQAPISGPALASGQPPWSPALVQEAAWGSGGSGPRERSALTTATHTRLQDPGQCMQPPHSPLLLG